jgi:hypothetical protein
VRQSLDQVTVRANYKFRARWRPTQPKRLNKQNGPA